MKYYGLTKTVSDGRNSGMGEGNFQEQTRAPRFGGPVPTRDYIARLHWLMGCLGVVILTLISAWSFPSSGRR